MDKIYYARLANKPYSVDPTVLADPQVSLTVTCYDDDPDVRNAQERATIRDLARDLHLGTVCDLHI